MAKIPQNTKKNMINQDTRNEKKIRTIRSHQENTDCQITIITGLIDLTNQEAKTQRQALQRSMEERKG